MSDQPDYLSDRDRLMALAGKVDSATLIQALNVHRTLADYEAIESSTLNPTVVGGVKMLRNSLNELMTHWEAEAVATPPDKPVFITTGATLILMQAAIALRDIDKFYVAERKVARRERLFLEALSEKAAKLEGPADGQATQ